MEPHPNLRLNRAPHLNPAMANAMCFAGVNSITSSHKSSNSLSVPITKSEIFPQKNPSYRFALASISNFHRVYHVMARSTYNKQSTKAFGSASVEREGNDPLVVQAARGEPVNRPPAWMMRQAGRYMAAYRKLAEKYPSFRERSETVDLIVEISLQPWRAFRPDGVIIFSDILTPLPAFGVPFEIDEVRGPVIQSPIRDEQGLKKLHPLDFEKLHFVGESLRILRNEIGDKAAVLGFVGAPWTIATYIVEGGTTRTYTIIKSMCHAAPHVLRALLSHLTQAISDYIIFQIVNNVRKACPLIPLVLYINGNGGLLERMKGVGVDVIGLDWTVDMADGRKRLGNSISVQGNVDPAYLFSPLPVLSEEIHRVVKCAGPRGHILNLGHGVLVNTPEDAVAHFFDVARGLSYDSLFEDHAVELAPVA